MDLQIKKGELEARIKRYNGFKPGDRPEHYRLTKHARIDDIQIALQAINNGTYGVCRDCKKNIPNERLEAVPGAIRCTHCQSQWEKGEKSC